MSPARIVAVDDEPEMLENIERILESQGHRTWTVSDAQHVPSVLADVRPDAVITDLRMPGRDGMEVLGLAQVADASCPVIVITAYATVATAVDAVQKGAFDYLAKPFTSDQLCIAVERALRYRSLMVENERLREKVGRKTGPRIVGSSPSLLRILERIGRVAATDANVLITGESGTGKELVARAIHDQSTRAVHPFVPVDCAALPEGLLESELFGHRKGAFTGAVKDRTGLMAEAHHGTVFFDEIGELTLPLQAKLLRVLEERRIRPVGSSTEVAVDVRILAATNVDLEDAVSRGAFREDLFYRINVVHLAMPPLRDRDGDIVLLVGRFLDECTQNLNKPVPEVTPAVWDVLKAYHWPGNVRQLRNLVEQIVTLDVDGRVTVSDLPPQMRFKDTAPKSGFPETGFRSLDYATARDEVMTAFHRAYLAALLREHDGNVSQAARVAGISRRTLHRWIHKERETVPPGVPEGDA